MEKKIIVPPVIELAALLLERLANGENSKCPKTAIKAYSGQIKENYIEWNNLQPAIVGRVVAIRFAGNFKEQIRKRQYLKMQTTGATLDENFIQNRTISSIWITEVAPHLT